MAMLIKNSDQNCNRPDSECDQCGRTDGTTYQKKYAIIAQGATGRWCEVMWICDACGDESGEAVEANEARTAVENMPHSWAEF